MKKIRFGLDALGVCASSLCMIHCLVFPLLLAALPLGNLSAKTENTRTCCARTNKNADVGSDRAACCSTPTDFWIHIGLWVTIAPLGIVAWGAGYRRHRRTGVLGLGLAGVLLLSGALLFGYHLPASRIEQVMTVAGSICMVSAHLWNRRQCRCCRAPDLARLVKIESAPHESQQFPLTRGGLS